MRALTHRRALRTYFRRIHYRPPDGALVIAVRIHAGAAGQPSFEYYSLGSTGFRYSYPKRFFVASAIKLLASVGALWALHRDHGLSSKALVDIHDIDGHYHGPIRALVRQTLVKSSNLGYDRLMGLAGFDAINDGFLVESRGLPQTVIQVRYGGRRPGISLRESPAFHFREGDRRGRVGLREGLGKHPQCPRLETCVSLYEMQEVLRRVIFDEVLPRRERIALAAGDMAFIRRLLLIARNRLQPGVREALGGPTKIYNNVGRVPGRDLVENAFIEHRGRKERYLMAALIPYDVKPDPKYVVKKRLSKLARHVLRLLRRRRRGRVLQHVDPRHGGSGEAITLALEREGEGLRFEARTAAGVDGLRAWLDAAPLSCSGLVCRGGQLRPGSLLVVESHRDRLPVGYRLLALTRDPRPGPTARRSNP